MIDIISLLSTDGYIMCNKTLIKLYGPDAAIMVGELCAEYNYYKSQNRLAEDDSFFSTQENIEDNTGLTPYYQRKALKTLQTEGIITVTKKGLPAKNYFWINKDKLCALFTTSREESEGLVVKSLNINNNKQIKITKNTLSKDNGTQSEFDFGISETKPTKPTNKDEYTTCLGLIENYTDDLELKQVLKTLLDNRVDICGKERHHFYASTFKNYLDGLKKVDDKIEAVRLSIQYNSVLKVMQPFKSTNSYSSPPTNPDTNKSPQKKSNVNDLARNDDGSLMTF